MEATVRDQVRQFILGNFVVGNPANLKDETSLLDEGIVDSTGMLEVINFLESEFGFKVDDAEMVPDNLGSIGNLTSYIARKRA